MTDILSAPFRLVLNPVVVVIILLALIFAVVLPVASGAMQCLAVSWCEHSVVKHTTDAQAIHDCLESNGPTQKWQSNSWRTPNKFFYVCQLDDGRMGMSIIMRTAQGLKEKTSFIVKNGKVSELFEYLTARATFIG